MKYSKRHFLILLIGCMALAAETLYFAFGLAIEYFSYPSYSAPSPSLRVLDSSGRPLGSFVSDTDEWYFPLKKQDISPYLYQAIVAVEDHRFFGHSGVDWLGVFAAAYQDLRAFKIVRGASTLTMQVEHLRHPRPRTFKSKIIEAVRAYQLERKMTKRELLTEYLNRCPMGGNLTGVGAASWRYFGMECRNISLSQAALLAGLPQSPNRYRPDLHPERAMARRNHVLHRMFSENMISEESYRQAVLEPLNVSWQPLPQEKNTGLLPALLSLKEEFRHADVFTTLNDSYQDQLSWTARAEWPKLSASQVNALCIVLLNTQSAECLASISLTETPQLLDLSKRFYSTGSALKPFIYAAAFEMGICSPSTLLQDIPSQWDHYVPSNYDNTFKGPMTAAEALSESRNIPAMTLLSKVGVPRMLGNLEALGFKKLSESPGKYGLSLAIGGAEASPLELAQAYATLGRGGEFIPATFIKSSPKTQIRKKKIIPSKICWQVLNALSQSRRTELVCPEAVRYHPAWKTGTSSRHRDAWCAAVTPEYTLVVWLGNVNGNGSYHLAGQTLAAPLALRLLASLNPKTQEWPHSPAQNSVISYELEKDHPPLSISGLSPDQEFFLNPDLPLSRQQLILKASGGKPETPRWWFINGIFIGKIQADENLPWTPKTGFHEIRVMDDTGAAAKINIRVNS